MVLRKLLGQIYLVHSERVQEEGDGLVRQIHFPEHQELLVVLRDYDRLLGSSEVGRYVVALAGPRSSGVRGNTSTWQQSSAAGCKGCRQPILS